MRKRLHFGKKNRFPYSTVIYGVIGLLAVAGITTYVVQRTRNNQRLLPFGKERPDMMSAFQKRREGKHGSQGSHSQDRTEREILEDVHNPIHPL